MVIYQYNPKRLHKVPTYLGFKIKYLFQAVEIPYLTQGLSLLIIVPRGISLRRLVEKVSSTNLTSVTKRMQTIRIAVSLPLYTLRMTLLLPSKLQAVSCSNYLGTYLEVYQWYLSRLNLHVLIYFKSITYLLSRTPIYL